MNKKEEALKKRRKAAVKKILLKNNLPRDMRDYWSFVMRSIDPTPIGR
jgi:hypothetical protein|tara:strand:- start:48 stop:191 length:144 start_codon:yes stop_codon:yes gene_type:complete